MGELNLCLMVVKLSCLNEGYEVMSLLSFDDVNVVMLLWLQASKGLEEG